MTLQLSDVATAVGSPMTVPSLAVTGYSVDSRTVMAGDLFFALRGPNHDGHEYLPEVFSKGAAAAVVDQSVETTGVLLRTGDTYEALASLARWARERLDATVVGVTGSAGKTTTKDTIAHLLAAKMTVGKTTGNFNNHVGLPLSILRLPDGCDAAILEIGMNHAGEIRRLAGIAKPSIGVVTNVGYAHVEFFDSIEGVARAKRELIESLPSDGTAILNADDLLVSRFGEVHPGATLTFGFKANADVGVDAAERTELGTRFRVAGSGWFETRLVGRHAIRNVLAAFAVARVFGYAPEEFREPVAEIEPAAMRGKRFMHNGVTVLDDCYNANPDAVRAMIETLREIPARRRIAVLGEMLELGNWSEKLHQEVGRDAAQSCIDVLVGIRGAARHMLDAAIEAGLASDQARFFEDPEPAGAYVRDVARKGDAILFKGSRGTHVERALEKFLS